MQELREQDNAQVTEEISLLDAMIDDAQETLDDNSLGSLLNDIASNTDLTKEYHPTIDQIAYHINPEWAREDKDTIEERLEGYFEDLSRKYQEYIYEPQTRTVHENPLMYFRVSIPRHLMLERGFDPQQYLAYEFDRNSGYNIEDVSIQNVEEMYNDDPYHVTFHVTFFADREPDPDTGEPYVCSMCGKPDCWKAKRIPMSQFRQRDYMQYTGTYS